MIKDDVHSEPTQSTPMQARAPAPKFFGAAKAFSSLFIVLASQFATGIVVVLIWITAAVIRGENPADPTFSARVTSQATPTLLLASGAISMFVVIGLARLWAWGLVWDKGSNGIGMTLVPGWKAFVWAITGATLACGYIAAAQWLVPVDPSTPLGPLAAAAASNGANRFAWALLALAFSPTVEEFFFRGLLLRGFTSSWGSLAGGLVVTTLFVLMHLTETIHFWPATVAITFMGILALLARRITGSLIPALAVHAAYNLVIVLFVFTR